MLHVSVVTPEKTLVETEADEVIIPTPQGEIAILPQHIPLLTQVAPGELIIKKGTNSQHLAVVGGFVELGNNRLYILADFGIASGDINERRAHEAKERAEKLLESKLTDEEFAHATAELERAMTQIRLLTKLKKNTQHS